MKKDFEKTAFYRSFMTCVFAGLIGTVLCMIYDLAFVGITGFPFSSIVNVSTLIFAINILFLIVGMVYYWSARLIKSGEIVYIVLFAVLMVFALVKIQGSHRSPDAMISAQFKWLSSGIVLILGLLALAVPALYRSRKFDELVL